MRRLSDLRREGAGGQQEFVRFLVASQLDCNPNNASQRDWARAWRRAEDFWERTVSEIDAALDDDDIREAEKKAIQHLRRIAYARLAALGWVAP
jgi:hypothetical protein